MKAYAVSDYEIWAANSAEEAMASALEEWGGSPDDEQFQYEVRELSDVELDSPFDETDEDEKPTGEKTTLRAELARYTEPGFLAAYGDA
ncbi:MAG: hypothetical protein RIS45_988 [Planctomycetota bacterium]|jgi:hypothetical protein